MTKDLLRAGMARLYDNIGIVRHFVMATVLSACLLGIVARWFLSNLNWFVGVGVWTGAVALGGLEVRMIRRRVVRPDRTKCAKCGYPLMGLSEPRCPECGTRFEVDQLKEQHGR